MTHCDKCSFEYAPTDCYCRQCGNELPEGDIEVFSCDCGAEVMDEDNFCHSCGAGFEEESK